MKLNMIITNKKRTIYCNLSLILFTFLCILFSFSCHEGNYTSAQKDSIAIRKKFAKSPPLSPEESLKHFKLQNGFAIRIVASEPLIQAPIAMKFDAKGRIWVVEMRAYMRDTLATGQGTSPTGEIVILSDENHDGVMDHSKVFMDSLVLPRAICFYNNGVLMAEPPMLWFVENNHDSAGAKYVIDSNYAVGGNPEHKANGLLRGLDNWIYNAKSDKRYREINGKWVIEHTHFRGQWGITQDNYGRLFYNTNSANLLGDYFLPGLGAWNPNQAHVIGFRQRIVSDNRTYPIRPTFVDRAYRPGVLDDSLRLINLTAACGPVIYRGGVFGSAYDGNAFVAAPAANLIKRDILKDSGYIVTGKLAYKGKEFLASDDERFRPVNLYNGPDGALYVVDMYRGIITNITYLSPYKKREAAMRHLQSPLNRGRIYKIIPDGASLSVPDLSGKSTDELVSLLDHTNSWVRLTAQRLLTDGKKTEAEDLLREKLKTDKNVIGKIHAFWTLEGLGKLTKRDILLFLNSEQSALKQQAIAAIVSEMDKENVAYWLQQGKHFLPEENKQLAPYLSYLASAAMQYNPQIAKPVLLELALKYKNNPYVSSAVISGLYGREEDFMQKFRQHNKDTSLFFYTRLNKTIANSKRRKEALKKRKHRERFARGQKLFLTYCEACHGADGDGIRSQGAPLNGSSWVTGDKKKLLNIVLYGLTGPVKVGGKTYKKPEVSGEMPAFGQDDQLSDEDIAHILSYIRNAWTNEADAVTEEDVRQRRKAYKGRQRPFTAEELK